MKFQNIQQFTNRGNYAVHAPWNMLEKILEDWNNRGQLELLPDFQRGHVWDNRKQIKYIEYGLRGGLSGKDIYFNCSTWMSSFSTPIQLVDGLQRITAVRRFLNNEIKAFDLYYKEYEDDLSFEISFVFHVNNLPTRVKVLKWYIELNEGGVVHTKKELDRVKSLLQKEINRVHHL